MSRLFDDAQSEYLEIDQAVVSGPPLAMACLFNCDADVDGMLMAIVDKDADDQVMNLYALASDDKLYFYEYDGSSPGSAVTTATRSLNTWHHAIAIKASATDRRVLLDGGNKGTDTTDISPSNLDRTSIGRSGDSSPIYYFSGKIAEAAIWDLTNWPGATNADKADNFERIASSLAKGFSPRLFPLGLKAYWDLVRGLKDKVGGYNLTASGTVVSAHPKVIYPVAPFWGVTHSVFISGQSDVAVSCTASLSVQKKLAGTADVSISATASLGFEEKLQGQAQVSVSTSGLLTRKRGLSGTSNVAISATGALNMKHLKGTVDIAVSATACMFKFSLFPMLSTSPRMESFVDEYSEETVIVDSYDSGYPLINPQFDFDARNFKPLLLYVSQTDKETLESFYDDHKEDIIRWLNEQESSYYDIIFIGKPSCVLAGSKDEWDIEMYFRQIRE